MATTRNYLKTAAQLGRQLRNSRFMQWWLGELATLLPSGGGDFSMETAVVAHWSPECIQLHRIVQGALAPEAEVGVNTLDAAGKKVALQRTLDKLRADRRHVLLGLPARQVLRKTVQLPLATEENLRQVLEYQVDQLTPFSAQQVYFGFQILARDVGRGVLTVDFLATPRAAVDDAVSALAECDVPVAGVFADSLLVQGQFVNLLPTVRAMRTSVWRQGANPWLAGVAGVLLLTALAMPLVIKREAIVQLLPWVDKGKKAAEITDALRRDLEAQVAEHNFVLEKRAATLPVVLAMEELSRVLPDDTWVVQLDIKGKELQIQGETSSSSRLIGLFEQSPALYDASFRSPLTKGQTQGVERYHLAIKIRSAGEAKP
jgi:general secretion pathway protein L